MNIAIPIFDRITALDAVGPYEVLSRIPGARVHFIAAEPGPKRTETGMLALTADGAFSDLPHPEVIVVPGGYGTRELMGDEQVLGWLRAAHQTSQWTTSVCPEPPYDSGSATKAPAEIIELVRARVSQLA